MVLYPEAQKTAQNSLDAIVGSSRFPTFADRQDLPIIDAMMYEVLRWKPIVPLGI
jgi:hypothetical protein